jgi:AcrR family transcriptional regulator
LPKKVDHDQRRVEIARVIREITWNEGVEGLKIRNVADKVGYGPSVVVHYFENKREMLNFSQRESRNQSERTVISAWNSGEDLEECVAVLLPISNELKSVWHLFFAFWGLAMYDPELAEERLQATSDAKDIFIDMIRSAQAHGEFDPDADPDLIAVNIQIAVNGIATLAMQNEELWPPQRQRAFLREELRRLGYRL